MLARKSVETAAGIYINKFHPLRTHVMPPLVPSVESASSKSANVLGAKGSNCSTNYTHNVNKIAAASQKKRKKKKRSHRKYVYLIVVVVVVVESSVERAHTTSTHTHTHRFTGPLFVSKKKEADKANGWRR